MITIPNYTSSLTPFTLKEKTTLTGTTYYILDLFGKQKDDTTLLFLTGDTTLNVDRYNYYPINLTPYNLIEGQYNYRVWQTPNNVLTTSGLTTTDIVEDGFCYIYNSGTTNPTIYTTQQNKYVYE
jgi:hypothetical protein